MKTSRRFEHKYIITYKDYQMLKSLIASMLIHDKHQEDESYPVNSIYLDDLVFTGASDKAFGNEYHKKYRIRYYHNKNNKRLELKEKVAEDSTKHSTPIDESTYKAILEQDLKVLEQKFDDPLIRRFTLDMLRHYLTPTCLISYKREAYKDKNDNLRITFDHSLDSTRYFDEKTGVMLPLLEPHKLILEVKYEHYLPKEIKQILSKYRLTKISYSKYFLGYNSLNA